MTNEEILNSTPLELSLAVRDGWVDDGKELMRQIIEACRDAMFSLKIKGTPEGTVADIISQFWEQPAYPPESFGQMPNPVYVSSRPPEPKNPWDEAAKLAVNSPPAYMKD